MLRLGRSQRPDWRRQGEVGGLNRPLQASDLPLVGTLVYRSHPRGICPLQAHLGKGVYGYSAYHHGGVPSTPWLQSMLGLLLDSVHLLN